jgi:hypothetical protein
MESKQARVVAGAASDRSFDYALLATCRVASSRDDQGLAARSARPVASPRPTPVWSEHYRIRWPAARL